MATNVDKALEPVAEDDLPMEDLEIEVSEDGEAVDVEWSVTIEPPSHDENLAEIMDDDSLSALASELLPLVEADLESRSEWEQGYIDGLSQLGIKIENRTVPWDGASGVFHPLLMEAVIRSQAQSMSELFPPSGPARTSIIGEETPERVAQAKRVEQELNYQITEKMTEFRAESEQMLFRTFLAGSGLKKVYYDPSLGRPVSMFVPIEDFIIHNSASDLYSCERYTHRMKRTDNWVKKMQASGMYKDCDLSSPTSDVSRIEDVTHKTGGFTAEISDDDRRVIYEIHADVILEGDCCEDEEVAAPYVITIDKASRKVLSVYKNWDEGDALRRKRVHFTHYPCFPGLGFYGLGYVHVLGGLSKSATSIMRQLIDAGTLSNLPGGLKSRNLRVRGDDTPIQPGEWRDVDVPGTSIRDNLFPLPYKEPSAVLYQLLNTVTEEGRRMASISDLEIGSMNNNAPVGTTLALLERNMKVMSAVQARQHAALKCELKMIAEIIHKNMPEAYDYDVGGDYSRREDFDGRVDVVPVSDPNASTMAQKVVQYQAAIQFAQSAPHIYNLPMLHRQMLEVLNIKGAEKIVPLEDDFERQDPVNENMAIIMQKPTKVFASQDHRAHITAHMAFAQDPQVQRMVGQNPQAPVIQAAMAAHVTEHIAHAYRVEMEKALGAGLPDGEQPLPEAAETELSRLVAQAAEIVLGKSQNEEAAKKAEEARKDPLIQLQEREMAIKEAATKADIEDKRERRQIEMLKLQADAAVDAKRIASEEAMAGAKLGVEIAKSRESISSKERSEGLAMGVKVAESRHKISSAEKIAGLQAGIQVGKNMSEKTRGDE